jgi:hypothetical protein
VFSVVRAGAQAADGRPDAKIPVTSSVGGRAGRHRDVQIFALRAPNRVHSRLLGPAHEAAASLSDSLPRLSPVGSVACVAVAFHPSAVRGADSDGPGEIDYRLARQSVISEYRKGRLARHEVCDAHPELVRAARQVGEPSSRLCPICEDERVVLVSYVFGPRLPSHGRCITTRDELARLAKRSGSFSCYVVEVCPGCSWNHLARTFLLTAPTGRAAAR